MKELTEEPITKELISTNAQNNSQKKKRIQYIDIARGIAIILMIIGHVIEGLPRKIIYSFHMPLFIIISGLLYKERNAKDTIKNILRKLILPYVICTLVVRMINMGDVRLTLYYLLVWLRQITFSYSSWGAISTPIDVPSLDMLWFLPLLALTRLIFMALKKISKDDSIKLLFLVAVTSFIGYLLGMKGYWLPFSLDVAMFCIVFYYIGYILNKTNALQKILSDKKLLILILFTWILGIIFDSVDIAGRTYIAGMFSVLSSLCGTIIILKVSQLIEKYLKYLGNILAWYGRNSIYILLFHYAEKRLIIYETILPTDNVAIYQTKVIELKLLFTTIGASMINFVKKAHYYFKSNKQNVKIRILRYLLVILFVVLTILWYNVGCA